ncbi:MAG: MetS family NSS transporter small subunit [Bacillota bacterium]
MTMGAIIMLLFGSVVLFGGLTICLRIALKKK